VKRNPHRSTAVIGFKEVVDEAERERRIRERAYRIWEDEGSPEGKDKQQWQRARRRSRRGGRRGHFRFRAKAPMRQHAMSWRKTRFVPI
jgi:hypothetical protein